MREQVLVDVAGEEAAMAAQACSAERLDGLIVVAGPKAPWPMCVERGGFARCARVVAEALKDLSWTATLAVCFAEAF